MNTTVKSSDVKIYKNYTADENELNGIKLTEGSIIVKTDITDYELEKNGRLDMFVAVYKNNQLVDVRLVTEEDIILSDGRKFLMANTEVSVDEESSIGDYQVSVMLWNAEFVPQSELVVVNSEVK